MNDPGPEQADSPIARTSIATSAARTLCVRAPMDTKSAPASAYARTFCSVIPPVASISIPGASPRARAAHWITVSGVWLSTSSRVAPAAHASSSCATDSTST